ncbi:MAG: hypothetical protein AAF191_05220, partial [Verrucomicrobiota bacterium]
PIDLQRLDLRWPPSGQPPSPEICIHSFLIRSESGTEKRDHQQPPPSPADLAKLSSVLATSIVRIPSGGKATVCMASPAIQSMRMDLQGTALPAGAFEVQFSLKIQAKEGMEFTQEGSAFPTITNPIAIDFGHVQGQEHSFSMILWVSSDIASA